MKISPLACIPKDEMKSNSLHFPKSTGRENPLAGRRLRTKYQSVIAKLGRLALSATSPQEFMDQMVGVIRFTLHVDLCEVMESDHDGTLIPLSGSGWNQSDSTAIQTEALDSMEAYAVLKDRTVIVEDFDLENRFAISARQTQYQVFSGAAAVITHRNRPYGILGVYTRRRRGFTKAEIYFLEAAANILSGLIDRKELEEAMQMYEAKYRALFEESKDAIFISTIDGELIDINVAGILLLGFESIEEILQFNFDRDLSFDPREREKIKAVLCEKGFVDNYDLVMKTKSGRRLFVQESSTAIRDQKGNVIAYRGILRDFTEIRELQEQLQSLRNSGT